MSEPQSSLLTNRQREYLRGEVEPSNESQMKKRIRERVYAGFRRDGRILLHELSIDERRKMFRHWEGKEDERHPDNIDIRKDVEFMNKLEKSTIEINIGDLLAFIYFGVEETNLSDFEELLESGLQQGAKQYGLKVSEFDLSVEFTERTTTRDLFDSMKDEQISVEWCKENVGLTHIITMAQSDEFDLEELPERYKELVIKAYESYQDLCERIQPDEFLEGPELEEI